jgi:hypothetical protein
MLANTEGAIIHGQSKETENIIGYNIIGYNFIGYNLIGYTVRRKTKEKHNTICVGHYHAHN